MMRSILKYFVCCILLCTLDACEHPDITLQNPNDLLRPAAEFAHNNFQFSLFYAAIERAGLVEELNGKGPFTIFAPGDVAFHEMGILNRSDLNRISVDSLKYLVRSHIIKGLVYREDVPAGTLDNKYISASGAELWLANQTAYTGIYINGATASSSKTNIRLSNGVFHEIDKVLKTSNSTLQAWLEKQENFSILVAGFKKFGLWEQLANTTQKTILAPDNAAFEQHGITKASIEALVPEKYSKRLFGAYIFPVRFFTTDIYFFPRAGTYEDYPLGMASIRMPIGVDNTFSHGINGDRYAPGEFFVIESLPENKTTPYRSLQFNEFPSRSDYLSSNGVVHQIESLIFLPEETLNH